MKGTRPRAAPLLEWALILTFLLHGLGMLAMAALLLPSMPGGPTQADSDRIALIAAHPWRFRLGWLPWHLTALSDLLLAMGLLRTEWIPRWPARLVLLLTIAAIIPDQTSQLLWITRGVELAQAAHASGRLTEYLAFEGWAFPLTGVWAALLYTLGALGWTLCFARAGVWSRTLTWLSTLTWGTFAVVTVGPLLPSPLTLPGRALAVGNALGFLLLMLWLALVTEAVLRRSRPTLAHGRAAKWRAPAPGIFGWALEVAANSYFVRKLCSLLPLFAFRSDITDVIYVNYLIEREKLEPWVPEGLELQRLGPDGRWALFTFLTYRHGHFGPALLGPLRRLFPSPVQSNWRVYVRDPRSGKEGIYFVTSAITTALHALGARLMAEGMPMHLLLRGQVERSADGAMRVELDPGQGSAPDARIELRPDAANPALTAPWSECFASYADMLRYTVPQDRAMSTLPAERLTVRHEIELGIPLTSCEPLAGKVSSRAAEAILGGQASALSFRVARVSFLFAEELHDPWQ